MPLGLAALPVVDSLNTAHTTLSIRVHLFARAAMYICTLFQRCSTAVFFESSFRNLVLGGFETCGSRSVAGGRPLLGRGRPSAPAVLVLGHNASAGHIVPALRPPGVQALALLPRGAMRQEASGDDGAVPSVWHRIAQLPTQFTPRALSGGHTALQRTCRPVFAEPARTHRGQRSPPAQTAKRRSSTGRSWRQQQHTACGCGWTRALHTLRPAVCAGPHRQAPVHLRGP